VVLQAERLRQPGHLFQPTNDTDIAVAPDRIDFRQVVGRRRVLLRHLRLPRPEAAANTNWAWSSSWYSRYLREDDYFAGFKTEATRELWEYFAAYPIYWLEKTGHPAGTPKNQSYKG
jgi:hypothetical protein